MKYSKNAYDKAFDVIQKRRRTAESEQQRRLDEISKTTPEIIVLQNKLLQTRFELMNVIMKGDADIISEIERIKQENLETQKTTEELLQALKGDKNYLDIHYYCEKCHDTGTVEGKRCDCISELLRQFSTTELNENCLIELNDFEDFSLEYYDKFSSANITPYEKMKHNLQYCKEYVESFSNRSPSLLFIGKTGLGKTFLSSCIAKALIENNVNVVFGSVIDFLRRIENEHFRHEVGNTLEILVNADIVILDDLGSEFQTSFTESVIYDIINSRINQNKPTIISTNLSYSELDGKYNERIVSRLACCYTPITFVGSDIRHKKRLQNFL